VPNGASLKQLADGSTVGMLLATVTGCLAVGHDVQTRYWTTDNSFSGGKQKGVELITSIILKWAIRLCVDNNIIGISKGRTAQR
jgi:hypothetical protein